MTPLKKYIWLVDTLMRSGDEGLTLEQIGLQWDADDDMYSNGAFSVRSFHRHRNEIEELFDIKIESHGSGHSFHYRIANKGKNDYFRHWLLNAIAVNRIVTDNQHVTQLIDLPQNPTHSPLALLIEALIEQRKVSFTLDPDTATEPITCNDFMPHALKRFNHRWHLVGRNDTRKPYRCLPLDRIHHCELQEQTFQRDPDFDIQRLFLGVYGTLIDENIPAKNICLKVSPSIAGSLRANKLHDSQTEIGHQDGYPIFALRLRPGSEFRQRLLSLGSGVEVLKPRSLRQALQAETQKMALLYQASN